MHVAVLTTDNSMPSTNIIMTYLFMLNSELSVTEKVINHSHHKVPGWSVIVQ